MHSPLLPAFYAFTLIECQHCPSWIDHLSCFFKNLSQDCLIVIALNAAGHCVGILVLVVVFIEHTIVEEMVYR